MPGYEWFSRTPSLPRDALDHPPPVLVLDEREDDSVTRREPLELTRLTRLERHRHRGHEPRNRLVRDVHVRAIGPEASDDAARGVRIFAVACQRSRG